MVVRASEANLADFGGALPQRVRGACGAVQYQEAP